MINHLTDFNFAGLAGTLVGVALDPLLFVPAIVAGTLVKKLEYAFAAGLGVFALYLLIALSAMQNHMRFYILEAAFFDIFVITIISYFIRKSFSKK